MLEFRVCLCLCSYTLKIRSRHSLHFSNRLSSLSPSQSLSVHFPAGETSVISRPGMDVVTVGNTDAGRSDFLMDATDSLNSAVFGK